MAPVATAEPFDEPLVWLMHAFPDISYQEILSAYNATHCSPSNAVDLLTSHSQSGLWIQKNDTPEDTNPSPKSSNKRKNKNKNKPSKCISSTGIVTPHNRNATNTIDGHTANAVPVQPEVMDFKKAVIKGSAREKPNNYLYTKRHAEEFLCSMLAEGGDLDLDIDIARAVLSQFDYDLPRSVDLLLEMLSSSSLSDVYTSDDDYTTDDDYDDDKTTVSSSGDFSVTSSELSKEVLKSLYKSTQGLYIKGEACYYSSGDDSSSNPSSDSNTSPSTEPAPDAYVYTHFRNKSKEHWDAMRDRYERAAVAYSKGHREHAGVLADEGRVFKNLASKAEQEASVLIFSHRNKSLGLDTLDLHCLHVNEAISHLKDRLFMISKSRQCCAFRTFKVITGKGSHGTGRGRIKRAVMNFLTQNGIAFGQENSGKFLIRVLDIKFRESSSSDWWD